MYPKETIDFHVKCFTLSKIGEKKTDIQDAYDYCQDRNRIAISDGVTTSHLPRRWADLLVKEFCQPKLSKLQFDSLKEFCYQWQEWLKPLQKAWQDEAIQVKQDKKIQNPNMGWLYDAKSKDHGAATFVGLQLNLDKWEVISVGDSCLFHIRNNDYRQVKSFPLTKTTDFSKITKCCYSLSKYKSDIPDYSSGIYTTNDIFLLATDALARWIIECYEMNNQGLKNLLTIEDQEDFQTFIESL
jgi:serine/threonine protein phosphatase PrpC